MLQVGSVVPGGCRVAIPGRLYGYGCRPLRTSPNLSLRYRLLERTGLRVSPASGVTACPGDDDLRLRFGLGSATGRDKGDLRCLCRTRRELHRHGERLHQRDRGADGPGVRPLPSRSPRSTRCRPTRRRPRHLMRTTRSRQRHLCIQPARGKGTSAYNPLAAKAPLHTTGSRQRHLCVHPGRGKGTCAYKGGTAPGAARGGTAGMVTVAAHPARAPHPARAWPDPSRAAFRASRPTASTCATSTCGTA